MYHEETIIKYEKAIKELENDLTTNLTTVAKRNGLDRGKFAKYLKRKGINYKREIRSEEKTKCLLNAVDLHINSGMSIAKAARESNIASETLSKYLKKNNLSDAVYNRKNYTVDENYFEEINTKDKAYWYGMLMADGCNRISKHNSGQLTLELSDEDYEHLEKFRYSLKYDGPIVKHKNRNTSYVTISRYKICYDLAEIGCIPNKTEKGWIDLDILSNNLKFDFLRGYIDGDGHIDKKRCRIIITVKSLSIMNSLVKLLSDFSPHVVEEDNYYRVTIESKNNFYNLLLKLYEDPNCLALTRKKEIAINRLHAHQGQLSSKDLG